jgi:hypothetical protein
MLKRLASALRSGRREWREYPERQARKHEQLLSETVDEVLFQLEDIAPATSMAFIKRFIVEPNKKEVETFLGAIAPLPVSHQAPLLIAVGRNAPGNWITWPAVQKWALKNHAAMAAWAMNR